MKEISLSLNDEGNHYKGIYHNGDITWFHPHPLNDLKKEYLTNMEEEIHKRMRLHFLLKILI